MVGHPGGENKGEKAVNIIRVPPTSDSIPYSLIESVFWSMYSEPNLCARHKAHAVVIKPHGS